MAHPAAGVPVGLGMGFLRGVSAVVVWPVYALGAASAGGGMGGNPGIAGVVLLAAIVAIPAAAAVVWLPFSTIGGAVSALPIDEAHAAEAALLAAAQDVGTSQRLAELVAETARRRGWRELVAREAADTVVEVRLVSVERGASWNWWSFDRPFPIESEAETRVIRRSDGALLWEARLSAGSAGSGVWSPASRRFEARERKYVEWAAEDGAPLRAEVDAQVSYLGVLFAGFVFGGAGGPAPSPPGAVEPDLPASSEP
jgi:hypothetical protein